MTKAALGGFCRTTRVGIDSEDCVPHCRGTAPKITEVKLASPRGDKANPVRWQSEVAILPKWAA